MPTFLWAGSSSFQGLSTSACVSLRAIRDTVACGCDVPASRPLSSRAKLILVVFAPPHVRMCERARRVLSTDERRGLEVEHKTHECEHNNHSHSWTSAESRRTKPATTCVSTGQGRRATACEMEERRQGAERRVKSLAAHLSAAHLSVGAVAAVSSGTAVLIGGAVMDVQVQPETRGGLLVLQQK